MRPTYGLGKTAGEVGGEGAVGGWGGGGGREKRYAE